MKYYTSKYSKKIVKTLLSAYLLVCVLSIFHFHNFSILQSPAIDNVPSETSHVKYLANTEFKCLIHQNLNSLQSVNIDQSGDPFTYLTFKENLTSDISDINLSTKYFSTNNLRAPPTNFS